MPTLNLRSLVRPTLLAVIAALCLPMAAYAAKPQLKPCDAELVRQLRANKFVQANTDWYMGQAIPSMDTGDRIFNVSLNDLFKAIKAGKCQTAVHQKHRYVIFPMEVNYCHQNIGMFKVDTHGVIVDGLNCDGIHLVRAAAGLAF